MCKAEEAVFSAKIVWISIGPSRTVGRVNTFFENTENRSPKKKINVDGNLTTSITR